MLPFTYIIVYAKEPDYTRGLNFVYFNRIMKNFIIYKNNPNVNTKYDRDNKEYSD